MPDGYDIDDVKKILSDYNQLVDVTESVEFNPYVFSFGKYKKEFDLFLIERKLLGYQKPFDE